MLASYLLSRTIVPTMAKYLLPEQNDAKTGRPVTSRNPLVRLQRRFEAAFERFRHGYRGLLEELSPPPPRFSDCFLRGLPGLSGDSDPVAGRGFFPHRGQRHFQTSSSCSYRNAHRRNRLTYAIWWSNRFDSRFRRTEVQSIIDNIGLPYSGINLSYSNSAPVGTSGRRHPRHSVRQPPSDGRLHSSTSPDAARTISRSDFCFSARRHGRPDSEFWIARPHRCSGRRARTSKATVATRMRCSTKSRYVPGTADLRIQQPFDEPYLRLRVERTKAEELGFTAHDIAQNLLVSLSGSFQTSPTFWVDPKNHVSYQHRDPDAAISRRTRCRTCENIPVTGTDPTAPPSLMASSGLHATGNRHGGGFPLQHRAGD